MFTDNIHVVEDTYRFDTGQKVTVRVTIGDYSIDEQSTQLQGQKSHNGRFSVIAKLGKTPVRVPKAVARAAAMVEGISSRKTMRVRVKR